MAVRHPHTRRVAALIQHDLIDLENHDDGQLGMAARFLGTLCDAKVKLKLPVEMTDDAIQAAIRNIQLRGAMRGSTAELHGILGVMAAKLGIPEIADGGYPKPVLTPDGDVPTPAAADRQIA